MFFEIYATYGILDNSVFLIDTVSEAMKAIVVNNAFFSSLHTVHCWYMHFRTIALLSNPFHLIDDLLYQMIQTCVASHIKKTFCVKSRKLDVVKLWLSCWPFLIQAECKRRIALYKMLNSHDITKEKKILKIIFWDISSFWEITK